MLGDALDRPARVTATNQHAIVGCYNRARRRYYAAAPPTRDARPSEMACRYRRNRQERHQCPELEPISTRRAPVGLVVDTKRYALFIGLSRVYTIRVQYETLCFHNTFHTLHSTPTCVVRHMPSQFIPAKQSRFAATYIVRFFASASLNEELTFKTRHPLLHFF